MNKYLCITNTQNNGAAVDLTGQPSPTVQLYNDSGGGSATVTVVSPSNGIIQVSYDPITYGNGKVLVSLGSMVDPATGATLAAGDANREVDFEFAPVQVPTTSTPSTAVLSGMTGVDANGAYTYGVLPDTLYPTYAGNACGYVRSDGAYYLIIVSGTSDVAQICDASGDDFGYNTGGYAGSYTPNPPATGSPVVAVTPGTTTYLSNASITADAQAGSASAIAAYAAASPGTAPGSRDALLANLDAAVSTRASGSALLSLASSISSSFSALWSSISGAFSTLASAMGSPFQSTDARLPSTVIASEANATANKTALLAAVEAINPGGLTDGQAAQLSTAATAASAVNTLTQAGGAGDLAAMKAEVDGLANAVGPGSVVKTIQTNDTAGYPVPGVWVYTSSDQAGRNMVSQRMVQSDAGGLATIVLVHGTQWVQMIAPGFQAPAPQQITV